MMKGRCREHAHQLLRARLAQLRAADPEDGDGADAVSPSDFRCPGRAGDRGVMRTAAAIIDALGASVT